MSDMLQRIIQSIEKAKEANAVLRVGPELEITGYGCLDHFLETDLYDQAWEVLADIIDSPSCQDILLDIGMPVIHRSVYYNCRVICRNRKILLLRPKMALCQDGNFREGRYFTAWQRPQEYEDHDLPDVIRSLTGQTKVTFGDAVVQTPDVSIGAESCEELFTPDAPHVHMGLDGVEIFTNSSGSHHELRKLSRRIKLIIEATEKSGGVYLYSNQQGCDGDRLYYDGCAMIVVNGEIKAQGSQFSLSDVEVITATIDLDDVQKARYAPSRREQAVRREGAKYHRIELGDKLTSSNLVQAYHHPPTTTQEPKLVCPEEEIALGPACWLWDYLRRSRQSGFFLPLSGGIDSCSTAVIVFSMCREVMKDVQASNEQVIEDVRRVCGQDEKWLPKSPQDICNRIFHTCFMGTSNSSADTRGRAKELADAVGAYHTALEMDPVVSAFVTLFKMVSGGLGLRYKVHGGSQTENLALQNLQARSRMIVSYLLASTLLPLVRGQSSRGGLLVLGSANVDESLRGYLTKYDCSSADLNPIGGISKTDLKRFIAWAEQEFQLPVLASFLDAVPTAELEPTTENYTQSDEADMGCTYAELSDFGRLRKVQRLGPYGQFGKLLALWAGRMTPRQICEKVVFLNRMYGVNRHKMTTITPSYHAEQYSPEDNRFDLRPFLYPPLTWAYEKMKRVVEGIESGGKGQKGVE
ncbi:MAG: glutamine-dependent NAD(+) synthetase [Chrysothrix sp. TS-e1954]|nr:MAG: glutamine-dependent NAD(+) synthetase [Chrysothrix sp. TS-e1954]